MLFSAYTMKVMGANLLKPNFDESPQIKLLKTCSLTKLYCCFTRIATQVNLYYFPLLLIKITGFSASLFQLLAGKPDSISKDSEPKSSGNLNKILIGYFIINHYLRKTIVH